jgi:hypothetical protein
LSPGEESEIRYYIHAMQRSGQPWDTLELRAMLADMLDPPQADEEDHRSLSHGMGVRRAVVVLDGGKDLDRDDPSPESRSDCPTQGQAPAPRSSPMI